MTIQNARDVTATSEYLKVLIVGDNGTGKSVFASTFPTPGRLFDFSNGVLTYRGQDWDYSQYESSSNGWVDYERDHLECLKSAKDGKYETVIIDDQTAMESLAMARALGMNPARNEAGGPVWNVHYQIVRNLVEGRLRQLLSLPCNVVLIAHLDVTRDPKTGAILRISPLMVGQLPTLITGMFDEVYYSSFRKEGDKTIWVLQTIPLGYLHARSRLSGKEGLLPNFIENDYASVMKAVLKARKKINDIAKTLKENEDAKKAQ